MRIVDRIEYLSKLCSGKKVLHVGCCGLVRKLDDDLEKKSHLHYALSLTASELWGIDTDQIELEQLRERGFANLYYGNANEISSQFNEKFFDIVLYGNMFNYLTNPGDVLVDTRTLLCPDGEVVITISNALAVKNFLRLLARGEDPSFRHHVFMTGPSTLSNLLVSQGYVVQDLVAFWSGRDVFYQQRSISKLANWLLNFMPRRSFLADNLMIRGTPN